MAFPSWSPSPEIVLLSTSIPAHASELTLYPSITPVSSHHSLSAAPFSSTALLDHVLEWTRIAIQRVLSIVVIAFGTFGNLMSIAVLTRRSMKSSTNRYLTALAVYDTLYLIFALTMTLSHYDAVRHRWWYGQYRQPYGRPLTDICSNTAIWLTLTFTVERYIGVCYPMKGKVWCTPRRAQYVILFVCVAAFLVTSPEFFELQMVEEIDARNRTLLIARSTQFGSRASYQLGYLYANQILFTFLPLVLLLGFNSLLIRAVIHASKNRRRMTLCDLQGLASNPRSADPQVRHQSDQQRITVMLIVVVIVFLICQLPQAVHKICHVYMVWLDAVGHRETLIFRIAANYFNLLVMINSSINFVLYSSFSTKFRTTFFRIFCVRIRHRGRSSLDSFRLGLQGTYFAQTECTNALTDPGRRRTGCRPSVGDLSLESYEVQRRRSRSASVATADRILRNTAAIR